jgi:hypothetical protein
MRPAAPTIALAAILAAFIALTSVIAIKTPAWEAADEPAHTANIETLVSGHMYRITIGKTTVLDGFQIAPTFRTELHQPPLYYALLAGYQKLLGTPARTINPGYGNLLSARDGLYLQHSPSAHRFLLPLRYANIALGIGMILLTFAAARLLSDDKWTPVVAAAVVASIPRLAFLSAFVTNDNLTDLLGALLTLVAVSCVTSPRRWSAAAAGAVIGLLLITKLSALPLVGILPVLAVLHEGRRRQARFLIEAAVSALAISGWYLAYNTSRYGDPLALHASQHYLTLVGALGTLGPYHPGNLLRLIFLSVPNRIFEGLWYTSGAANQFRWPWFASLAFWLALAWALSGLASSALASQRAGRAINIIRLEARRVVVVLASLTVLAFACVWLVAFGTGTYEARLAFDGLPALGCLTALGLERWRPPVRFVLPLMGLCGTIVAIRANVYGVHWTA